MVRHFKEVCIVCKSVNRQCPCNEPNKTVVLVTCDDCRKKIEEQKVFSLDDLQAAAEKLVDLLKDRQPDHVVWSFFMRERLLGLHKIASQMLGIPSPPTQSVE